MFDKDKLYLVHIIEDGLGAGYRVCSGRFINFDGSIFNLDLCPYETGHRWEYSIKKRTYYAYSDDWYFITEINDDVISTLREKKKDWLSIGCGADDSLAYEFLKSL